MGVLDRVRGRRDARTVSVIAASSNDALPHQPSRDTKADKPGLVTEVVTPHSPDRLSLEELDEKEVVENPDQVTKEAELGLKKAEAAALVWPRAAVFGTYGWIWVCFFMLAFHSAIGSNVIFFAYANFQTAPQVSEAYILASIIGGVLRLPIAKTLNIWGRAEGFVLFLAVYLLGIIVIASSTGPHAYAAGYTLYWIGYDALYFIMDIFIVDTSGLRNRAFAFAFSTTPFICTAFTGPLAAQSLLKHASWRWAYGAFAIVQFFVFMPLAIVFKFYQRKAERLGLFTRPPPSGRTRWQSVVHYAHEFDVVGALLLTAAFVLFLLPFSLEQYGFSGYRSATFIVMVVLGFCLFFVFAAWERYGARTHFIKYELLRKRTVLGACLLAAVLFFSFYAWDEYYYAFVQVAYNLDISMAGYMSQIYNVGSSFWSVVFGLWIRQTRHFKWPCLLFGLPLMMLGAGLMIHFRGGAGQGGNDGIGFVVMCQIFIAFGGGTLVIGEDMAIMAASDRDGVPMLLATLNLFASLGGAIGYAVAAAIYANTFPDALRDALPDDLKSVSQLIYLGGTTNQTSWAVGSPARNAINHAWGASERLLCITATVVLVLGIPCIAVWKNYSVDRRQNKGVVI